MQDAIQVTGTWTDEGQYLQADTTGHVRLNFIADSRVHRGRHARGRRCRFRSNLTERRSPAATVDPALTDSGFTVTRQDLFQLLSGVSPGYHLIDLTVPAGFRIYTFTFG